VPGAVLLARVGGRTIRLANG
jgi:D-alanyl-D-alanine carboxypeptidase